MLLYKQIEYSNHIMTGNSLGYISQYFGCCRKNFFFKNFEFLHNTTPSLQTEFYNIPLQVLQKLHWAITHNRAELKLPYYNRGSLSLMRHMYFYCFGAKKNIFIIFIHLVLPYNIFLLCQV